MADAGMLNNPLPSPEKVLAKIWLAEKPPCVSRTTTVLGKFPGVALMAAGGMLNNPDPSPLKRLASISPMVLISPR